MRISLILSVFLILPGCTNLGGKLPVQIKAALEGDIKGYKVNCEGTLALGDGQWGAMCGIANGMDVQYRVNRVNDEQAKVKFLVSKEKNGRRKIIATPSLVLKNKHSAENTTTTDTSNIVLRAQRLQ